MEMSLDIGYAPENGIFWYKSPIYTNPLANACLYLSKGIAKFLVEQGQLQAERVVL